MLTALNLSSSMTKDIKTTEHADGRKDVTVSVQSLDVDLSDPTNKQAKEYIEKNVLPRLNSAEVLCVLIHKPSNDSFSYKTTVPLVRANAEVAIKKHAGVEDAQQIDFSQYCIVQVSAERGVMVTSI